MCARMCSIWLSIEMKRAKEFDLISSRFGPPRRYCNRPWTSACWFMLVFYAFAGNLLPNPFYFCVVLCACVWSYTRSLWMRCLTNRLWEFHQIYNVGAAGDKDEPVKFWGQRSGSQRGQIWWKKHFGNFEGCVFKRRGRQPFRQWHAGRQFAVKYRVVCVFRNWGQLVLGLCFVCVFLYLFILGYSEFGSLVVSNSAVIDVCKDSSPKWAAVSSETLLTQ